MTILHSPAPSGLRDAVTDTLVMTGRDLAHWRARPGTVAVAWLFPVMVVLMFAALFGGAIEMPAGADYVDVLMPGTLTMTMVFGLEATMLAVVTDASRGVTDRFRSLPMASAAVVLARCLADLLHSIVGLAVMAATGLALGWRWPGGAAATVAAAGLLLLLRFSLLWLGVYLGLRAKGPESVVAVQILVWPLLFASNVFVDPATMPGWLGTLAGWNPVSATAGAVRSLLGSPEWGAGSWAADHAVALALAWPVLLTAVFLPASVRRFRALGN